MKKIPQDRFLEMNEDVYVDVLFPNMQVDVFKYKSSHRKKDIGDVFTNLTTLLEKIEDKKMMNGLIE
jgi:hypothetical protein